MFMNEKLPISFSSEQLIEKEGDECCKNFFVMHPEPVIAQENLRNCEAEVAQWYEMIDNFKSKYSLAELHSIVDITLDNAPQHSLR